MKKILSIPLTSILIFACAYFLPKTSLHATHITGGELSYECLGANTYKLTLKIYRDCLNGLAGFDDPAKVTVWTGDNVYMNVFELPYTGATPIPYIAADTNWIPEGNACVETAIYIDTVHLSTSATGYMFAYQRCCRTGNITNLVDPLSTGSTYTAQVPATYLCNNSPVFNHTPPLVLCVNKPMSFDHAATDPDGDSLVYYLCNSYDGALASNPQPYMTSPPPFSYITYLYPYSETYPMFAVPNLAVDPFTGMVTVTPWGMGNFVVGICCDEYRSGVLIGSHHSDFRYSVANCPYGIGIEDYSSLNCEIYPNPAKDFIQIKTEQDVNVMVFDMLGKMVYHSSTANKLQTISTTEWSSGVYTYRAFSASGVATGRLIIQ